MNSSKVRIPGLSNPFEDLSAFLDRYLGTQFPFAIYRLPNTSESNGVMGLDELVDLGTGKHKNSSGFSFNRFIDHHPSKPEFINGDIIFTDSRSDLIISNTLSATAIERFISTEPIKVNIDTSSAQNDVDFPSIVSKAVETIANSELEKVVVSRYQDKKLPEDFDLAETYHNACQKYPNAFVYILSHPSAGVWFGATPEKLISTEGEKTFSTVSLAATQKLSDSDSLANIAWTQKEIEEQAYVSRYVVDCFKKIRLREFEERGPKTIKAGSLAHLKTEFMVDMQKVNIPDLGDIMKDLLHPTSAVCGMPLENALSFIKRNESYDRELYAGFLGPVNLENRTDLFVNLRCMNIAGNTGRFYAGAGITADSDPESEMIETELKMRTVKNLIF